MLPVSAEATLETDWPATKYLHDQAVTRQMTGIQADQAYIVKKSVREKLYR